MGHIPMMDPRNKPVNCPISGSKTGFYRSRSGMDSLKQWFWRGPEWGPDEDIGYPQRAIAVPGEGSILDPCFGGSPEGVWTMKMGYFGGLKHGYTI